MTPPARGRRPSPHGTAPRGRGIAPAGPGIKAAAVGQGPPRSIKRQIDGANVVACGHLVRGGGGAPSPPPGAREVGREVVTVFPESFFSKDLRSPPQSANLSAK